jgi:hypothetical protein
LRILGNFAAAVLLSTVVTIIAGRLADTEFPIKVTVNDLWGALTIGFVSYFVGNRVIAKLSKLIT